MFRSASMLIIIILVIFYFRCASYGTNPILPSLSYSKKSQLLCRFELRSESSYEILNQELMNLSDKYIFLKSDVIDDTVCRIEIKPIPNPEAWTMITISILTLGLIPIYEPYRETEEIRFSYTKNSQVVLEKKYIQGYSAWYWLPLVPSIIWDRKKLRNNIEKITDDFFYTELSKLAQDVLAHPKTGTQHKGKRR